MKQHLFRLIAAFLLIATLLAVLPAAAEEGALAEGGDSVGTAEKPWENPDVKPGELIITEIGWMPAGLEKNTACGYTPDVALEAFEFIEILNTTDHEINLYEYGLTYTNAARDNEKFEYQITEYTPFKPGDFWDGTKIEAGTEDFSDLSNKYVNPETFMIQPGECIVVWMANSTSYLNIFNEGKGLSMADFRFHWDIPEDVRCVAFDSNASADLGGSTYNFTTVNSGTLNYGIVHQSEEINTACNTSKKTYIKQNYWESDHLVSWTTVDFNEIMYKMSSVTNKSMSFTWDFKGYSTTDKNYITDTPYVYDARRSQILSLYDDPTPGRLTAIQKMTLGMELEKGETYKVDKFTMYYPKQDAYTAGIQINGEMYFHGDVFTAPDAGLYTFDYLYQNDPKLQEPGVEAPWERDDVKIPELIITEIGWDTAGLDKHTSGYNSEVTQDAFEFFEICNTSDHEINLYEYALVYTSAKRDNAKFEYQITEYTPFKPGNFWDGSKALDDPEWYCDLSNKYENPETCVLAPGECIVVWMVAYENYNKAYNDGKGLGIDDFRLHWDIPEDVRCIALDANGDSKKGGKSYNFTISNNGVGTYGLVRQSDHLNTACNTSKKYYVKRNYWDNDLLISWTSIDHEDLLYMGTVANVSATYTWDFKGYGATDQTYITEGNPYVYDARRGYMLTVYDNATPGTLSPIQKMTLGMELAEGESFTVDNYVMYYPMQDEYIRGLNIDGRLYKNNDVFTAPKAGVYPFDFFFQNDVEKTFAVTLEIKGYPFDQPAAVNVVTGTCMEEPDIQLPDDGSTFDGWYTSADCNADSRFDFSTPITEDMTLYALLIPAETVTEEPTEEPTDPVTEAPTDPETEAPTEAPAAAPTESDTEKASGCGSVLALSFLPVTAAAWLVLRKKRED